MKSKRPGEPSPAQLARMYRNVHEHPLGGLLVEDLAASREHGVMSARISIAADGQPIIYARDEAVARQIGEAVQHSTAVHVRTIPPLDVAEFRILAEQAQETLTALPSAGQSPERRLVEIRQGIDDPETRIAFDGSLRVGPNGDPALAGAIRVGPATARHRARRGERR